MKEKVFDIHAHIFPDKVAPKVVSQLNSYYGLEIAGAGTPEDLKEAVKRDGTNGALVFSTATKPQQVRGINDFLSAHIGRPFLCFGSMHPDYGDVRGEVIRMKQLGLLGVKLHPDFQAFDIDSPAAMRMFSVFEEEDMRVLIHMGDASSDASAPFRLKNVIDAFPSLRVLAAHLGGLYMWEEARRCLYGRDIFLDTSSSVCFLPPEKALELIRSHDTEKICFGTDYPIHTPAQELVFFDRLALTPRERGNILYNNAFRFLGVDPQSFDRGDI